MKRLLFLFAICFISLVGCSRRATTSERLPAFQEPYPLVAVQGVVSSIEDDVWKDSRIGLGIETLLATELAATGPFRICTEDSLKRKSRHTILARAWATTENTDLGKLPIPDSAAYAAYAHILSYGPAQYAAGQSPYRRSAAILLMEVCILNRRDNKNHCAIGAGQSPSFASNANFIFDGNYPQFEQSDAGKAIVLALRDALNKLVQMPRSPSPAKNH